MGSEAESRFVAYVTRDPGDVLEAQRLRHRVYRGVAPDGRDDGAVDADLFDPFCDHLIARDTESGVVVGTYRILSAEEALRAGSFYSETEFELGRLRTSAPRLAEVGRACVHPSYRSGGVIAILLAALARHLVEHAFEHVIGCASVHAATDPGLASTICRELLATRLAPPKWRVAPRRPFPLGAHAEASSSDGPPPYPPLIKAYVRLGAYVCGPPAWDEDFGTADLLLMLPMAAMDPRYRQRLLRTAA